MKAMERKRIMTENSLHQSQEFGINEYEDHIEIGRLLSVEIEKVEISDIIDEKPVTVIGEDCFFNCVKLKEILLPNTIESIGAQAFALCKGLTDIVLPDSVKEIGHHAFRDCQALKKVILPKGLKSLPIGVFSFCYLHNPEIVLPDGLEVIENGAFWSGGVFDLLIPDSVKEIGVGAFNWGPRPITKLPYDKGWFSQWPFGEAVTVDNIMGKITDLHYLEEGCKLHEVAIGEEVKPFFYPCDYLDGKIQFESEKNRQRMDRDIKFCWKSENDLSNTYKIRDAWKRGLVEVR